MGVFFFFFFFSNLLCSLYLNLILFCLYILSEIKNLIKNKLVRNYNFRLGANCFMKNWKLVVFYGKHSHKSPGIFFFSKAAPFSVRNIALCDFFSYRNIHKTRFRIWIFDKIFEKCHWRMHLYKLCWFTEEIIYCTVTSLLSTTE